MQTPQKVREQTEGTILAILSSQPNGMQWTELLKKAKVSRKTLSDRLESLQKRGLITRIVDAKHRPPVVYYLVMDKARLDLNIKFLSETIAEYEGFIGSILPSLRLKTALESLRQDLVFTVRHALKAPDRKAAWWLIHWHSLLYSRALSQIMLKVMNDLDWQKEVEEIYAEIKIELKKGVQQFKEKFASNLPEKFQSLAYAFIDFYLSEGKGNVLEALENLAVNEKERENFKEKTGLELYNEFIEEARNVLSTWQLLAPKV